MLAIRTVRPYTDWCINGNASELQYNQEESIVVGICRILPRNMLNFSTINIGIKTNNWEFIKQIMKYSRRDLKKGSRCSSNSDQQASQQQQPSLNSTNISLIDEILCLVHQSASIYFRTNDQLFDLKKWPKSTLSHELIQFRTIIFQLYDTNGTKKTVNVYLNPSALLERSTFQANIKGKNKFDIILEENSKGYIERNGVKRNGDMSEESKDLMHRNGRLKNIQSHSNHARDVRNNNLQQEQSYQQYQQNYLQINQSEVCNQQTSHSNNGNYNKNKSISQYNSNKPTGFDSTIKRQNMEVTHLSEKQNSSIHMKSNDSKQKNILSQSKVGKRQSHFKASNIRTAVKVGNDMSEQIFIKVLRSKDQIIFDLKAQLVQQKKQKFIQANKQKQQHQEDLRKVAGQVKELLNGYKGTNLQLKHQIEQLNQVISSLQIKEKDHIETINRQNAHLIQQKAQLVRKMDKSQVQQKQKYIIQSQFAEYKKQVEVRMEELSESLKQSRQQAQQWKGKYHNTVQLLKKGLMENQEKIGTR